jgi:prepilin-type N-terminal cleavage/methylation domain-containing protein
MLPWLHIYPNKHNKIKVGAFSLIELLIAVSIFSVTSIAIYSTFNSGSTVLRRVKNIDFGQQKILLKTEKIARELREQPDYRKQLFGGTKSRISFSGKTDYLPCRITYYFDSSSLCLMRVVDQLKDIITPEGRVDVELKSKPSVFLSKIKGIKFAYLYLDSKKNEYYWVEEWSQDYLPVAVKFIVTSQNQEYASTVFLPRA